MEIRSLLVLGLVAALAACTDATAPSPTLSENQTAVMTASVSEVRLSGPDILFGATSIDTVSETLGQTLLGRHEFFLSMSVPLEGAETANLLYATNGAIGLESGGEVEVSVKVLSDWKAVEPEKHRGVVYDGVSHFHFRVMGFALNAAGSIDFNRPMPERYFVRTSTTPNSSVTLTLPPERSVRFVFVAQRRSMPCAGNDSLTIRSSTGLIQTYKDRRDHGDLTFPQPIQEATVRCVMYESSAVKSYPSIFSTVRSEMPGRRQSVEKVGDRYFMRLR